MRKLMPYALAALVAGALVVPAHAATSPQKPGKWQVTMQMEMPGIPVKIPPVTTTVCLTQEDVDNPQKAVPNDAKNPCKVGDYKIEGNKVTWTVDCPKQQTTGNGEITFDGDSYTGFMAMKVGDNMMKTKYSGKWMGTCEK